MNSDVLAKESGAQVDVEEHMEEPVAMSKVIARVDEARQGLDVWIDELEKRLRAISAPGSEKQERRICEATRMNLVFGRYLHFLTLVVLGNELPRPSKAWDQNTAAKALDLFQKAEVAITKDVGRRERITSRLVELKAAIGDWCPGFVVTSATQVEPS